MIMELFPDPRRLTDQDLQARIDSILASSALGAGKASWATAGLTAEQRRRAAMTSHERIALARSLAHAQESGE